RSSVPLFLVDAPPPTQLCTLSLHDALPIWTLVNRVWQRLFGRGLVENADEMDGEPWSPALLDWLASDFVEHGYDIKRLIATIVIDRKSTRLNSSHVSISYAVFCLKKKKNKT